MSLEFLANSLHILLCQKPHVSDPTEIAGAGPDVCCYYAEESMVNCWDLEDHVDWMTEAINFCTALSLNVEMEDDLTKARHVFNRLREVGSQAAFLVENYPGMFVYLARLLSVMFSADTSSRPSSEPSGPLGP